MTTVNITHKEVWISEPRWTWFWTPLFECNAIQIKIVDWTNAITAMRPFNRPMPGMTDEYVYTTIGYIYLTHEEHVYWKLHDIEKAIDMGSLFEQGKFYF